MRSLWRALALAWLGGVGSPLLLDAPSLADPPTENVAPGEDGEGAVVEGAGPSDPTPVGREIRSRSIFTNT
jgi:hypothetical protein